MDSFLYFPRNVRLLFILLTTISLIAACAPASKDQPKKNQAQEIITDTISSDKGLQEIYSSLPSPIEIIGYFDEQELSYNGNLLNPSTNRAKYLAKDEQLFNIGIYSADLAYQVLFRKNSQIHAYFQALEKLSADNAMHSGFSQDIKSKLNSKSMNKDTLLLVANDVYVSTMSELFDSKRQGEYALISSGVFIESIYLVAFSANPNKKEQLIRKVMTQKLLFDDLFAMLHKLRFNESIAEVYQDIINLKVLFDKIEVKTENVDLKENKTNEIQVSGSSNIDFPDNLFDEMKSNILKIRTKWVTAE